MKDINEPKYINENIRHFKLKCSFYMIWSYVFILLYKIFLNDGVVNILNIDIAYDKQDSRHQGIEMTNSIKSKYF